MTDKIRIPRVSEVAAATLDGLPAVARALATGKDETTVQHVREAEVLGEPRPRDPDRRELARGAAALGPTKKQLLGSTRRGSA